LKENTRFFIIRTSRLMVFREIVAVCCQNKMNHVKTVREKDISHVRYSTTNNGILGRIYFFKRYCSQCLCMFLLGAVVSWVSSPTAIWAPHGNARNNVQLSLQLEWVAGARDWGRPAGTLRKVASRLLFRVLVGRHSRYIIMCIGYRPVDRGTSPVAFYVSRVCLPLDLPNGLRQAVR
jgi:hypothetical protein